MGKEQSSLLESVDYYSQVYPDYEKQNPDYKYAHYLQVMQGNKPAFNTLLDFGCAHGRFLSYLSKYLPNVRLSGMDKNKPAIEQARLNLPDISLASGDLQELQVFPPVDVITAFDVLEHMPEPKAALLAFQDKLSDSGLVVAVMPVYDGPLGWLVHLLDKDPTHVCKQSRTFWLELFSHHFEIQNWHGIFRFLMPWGYYLHMPTCKLRYISPAILIVAAKKAR